VVKGTIIATCLLEETCSTPLDCPSYKDLFVSCYRQSMFRERCSSEVFPEFYRVSAKHYKWPIVVDRFNGAGFLKS